MKHGSCIPESYLLVSQRHRLKLLTKVAASMLLLALGIAPVLAGSSKQEKFTLPAEQMWVNSGTWRAGSNDDLFLVDALSARIVEFKPNKASAEMVQVKNNLALEDLKKYGHPESLQAVGNGYILQTESTVFRILSSDLQQTSFVDLAENSKGPQGQIRSAYTWAPLSEDVILTYSDILRKDGTWTSAFLRVPLRNPAKFEILYELDIHSSARSFYLLGYPYVAAASTGRGYFLVMDTSPTLYEVVRQGPAKLVPLKGPRVLQRNFELPKKDGVETAVKLFDKLQKSALPAGIYAEGTDLYLLTREPALNGKSDWALAKLKSEAFSMPYRIKTGAAHLTIIPGPTFAVLEKDEVKALGIQAIPSVLLIPKADLDAVKR